jgi:hypothetical protein
VHAELNAAVEQMAFITDVALPGIAELDWRCPTVLLVSVTVSSHTRWNAVEAQL